MNIQYWFFFSWWLNLESLLKPVAINQIKPPFWALGGHQQTLWGHFLYSPQFTQSIPFENVALSNGDQLAIQVIQKNSEIVVSLFHGLSGSTESDYMQRTARICEQLGLTCVLVNHRGAGAGRDLAKLPYHSGIAEDISSVLDYLKLKFPSRRNITVGFSMSGNIILNLVSGNRGSTRPDAAITVNAPINLTRSSLLLRQGVNRVYDKRFITLLKDQFLQKQNEGLLDPSLKISSNSTIWDLDEIFTAPLCGFQSRADYYESCSSFLHLHKIAIPTYVLTSADDPFVSPIDYLENPRSLFVQMRVEQHGGHLGYIDGSKHSIMGRRWLDQYLYEALKHLKDELK